MNTDNLCNETEGENGRTRKNLVALPLIPHGLAWDRIGTQT